MSCSLSSLLRQLDLTSPNLVLGHGLFSAPSFSWSLHLSYQSSNMHCWFTVLAQITRLAAWRRQLELLAVMLRPIPPHFNHPSTSASVLRCFICLPDAYFTEGSFISSAAFEAFAATTKIKSGRIQENQYKSSGILRSCLAIVDDSL